jgi:hypothetical protein
VSKQVNTVPIHVTSAWQFAIEPSGRGAVIITLPDTEYTITFETPEIEAEFCEYVRIALGDRLTAETNALITRLKEQQGQVALLSERADHLAGRIALLSERADHLAGRIKQLKDAS